MNHTLNLTYEEIDLLKTSILIRLSTLGAERCAFERQCDRQTQATSFSRTYIAMRNAEFESRHKELAALINKLNEAAKI